MDYNFILECYYEYLDENKVKNTAKTYYYNIRKFLKGLSDKELMIDIDTMKHQDSKEDIKLFLKRDVTSFLLMDKDKFEKSYESYIIERNLSEASKNTLRLSLINFYDYLISIGIAKENLAKCLEVKKAKSEGFNLISDDDIEKIIRGARQIKSQAERNQDLIGARDVAMVVLILKLGLKTNQIASIKLDDLDLENKTLRINNLEYNLDNECVECLNDYMLERYYVYSFNPHLFISKATMENNKKIMNSTILAEFNKALKNGLGNDMYSIRDARISLIYKEYKKGTPLEDILTISGYKKKFSLHQYLKSLDEMVLLKEAKGY